jgi:peptidoglycan hydrolase-like protein with peptidoglycan-binding domain
MQGMQGPAVAEVQKMLGIEADGKFGPATKARFLRNVGRVLGVYVPM